MHEAINSGEVLGEESRDPGRDECLGPRPMEQEGWPGLGIREQE